MPPPVPVPPGTTRRSRAGAPVPAVRGSPRRRRRPPAGPPGSAAPARTPAASVRVAPLVTTSSTSTSSAPRAGPRPGVEEERARQVRPPLGRRQRRRVLHPPAPAQQPGLGCGTPAARSSATACRVSSRTWSRPRVRSAAGNSAPGPAAAARAAPGPPRLTAATASASAVPSGRGQLGPAPLLEGDHGGPHGARVGAGGDRRREAPRDPPRRREPRPGQQRGAGDTARRPGRPQPAQVRGSTRSASAATPIPHAHSLSRRSALRGTAARRSVDGPRRGSEGVEGRGPRERLPAADQGHPRATGQLPDGRRRRPAAAGWAPPRSRSAGWAARRWAPRPGPSRPRHGVGDDPVLPGVPGQHEQLLAVPPGDVGRPGTATGRCPRRSRSATLPSSARTTVPT